MHNLTKVSFIQEEWFNHEFPYIHGWVFNLNNGLLKDLGIVVNSSNHLDKVYQYDKKC